MCSVVIRREAKDALFKKKADSTGKQRPRNDTSGHFSAICFRLKAYDCCLVASLERPEPGGAADATGISVFRRHQRRYGCFSEDIILEAPGNVCVDGRDLGSSAARHRE